MVENLLRRNDRRGQIYEVGAYHNAMSAESRNRNLHTFSHGIKNDRDGNGKRNKKNAGDSDYVLVCTDRAARGVDFDAAPVDHVVIFDFPKDPAEYVRRVGRTARAGRAGTSTVFAFGWQLPIARSVMGKTLDGSRTALGDDEDPDGVEYSKADRRRRKQIGKQKDEIVKGRIETKRKWDKRTMKS